MDAIKECIELIIQEMAAIRNFDSIALSIYRSSNNRTSLCLYDYEQFLDVMSNKDIDLENIYFYAKKNYQFARAFIDLSPERENVREVKASAALKGYGPAIYDIAMQEFGPICADRSEVSASALKVWSYYYNKRDDVQKHKLDNHKLNNEVLSYAYEIKRPLIDVDSLTKKHDDTSKQVLNVLLQTKDVDIGKNELNRLIYIAGMKLFFEGMINNLSER